MIKSFKNLSVLFILCFFAGCSDNNERKEIGENIINDNADLFVSNLYTISPENTQIFLIKKVSGGDFIDEHCDSIVEMEGLNLVENCKKELYEFLNKEGFDINENTKYVSFDLEKFPSKRTVKLIVDEQEIREKEYIEVSFSNFYIDNKLEKGFVIVRESNLSNGRYGGKVEIYFFENKGNRWKLYKNEMLLTA
ncbi:hypothetical protein SAMN05421876_10875 [Kaistella jeonii]|uniref:Lipoprotein n=2 Tax=Kaistella jeonii TaxID=266749 RepID=A0A0C1CVV5_9FLAO|nr:hypothetical protein OA86_10565 [Kaistella jeonii]SFC17834.1 hypothetical protein SAMN05421876_10875 [Kaistella jeonii]VEI95439.1 Uncharacterised protein [Kaistella jeonii]